MKKEVISHCPVCHNELTITKLQCEKCQIEISGEFHLSRLSLLTSEQLMFVELFLKNHGNIKGIEKEMGVSYPTVKKMLSDILISLGFENNDDYDDYSEDQPLTRQEVLEKLANGEISFSESVELLKKLNK
ncbi:MAG TPA: DUF2089 domain-containing protein [Bacilli bacterium]|nr:DUF2089 domain-containing protein [Bacilli bacterium]